MSQVQVLSLSVSPQPPKVRDGWSIRVVTDPEQLASDQAAWTDLAAQRLVEVNPLYSEPGTF